MLMLVVATHVGTPPSSARTKPFVVAARRERTFVAETYKRPPAAYAVRPVPPYSVPTLVVAETTPAFAWRGPFSVERRVRPFVPETVRAVVEAYGNREAVVDVATR